MKKAEVSLPEMLRDGLHYEHYWRPAQIRLLSHLMWRHAMWIPGQHNISPEIFNFALYFMAYFYFDVPLRFKGVD